MNFYTYIFMKKYTLNFTTATVQGAKKIPPKRTWAGFFLNRQRFRSNAADVSGDRNHRIR
ncbi:MAG: hypothetical protein ACRER3_23820 [Pseudomonas fluorescens]